VDLVEKASQVDWEGAYLEHYDAVYRLARVVLGDHSEVADVVQMTFEAAYRSRGRFDVGRPLRPWLLGIAAHKAVDVARRRRLMGWLRLPENHPSSEHPGETALERAVWAEVAKLSPSHRAVVGLHWVHGYDLVEVAAILGVPAGTARSRLYSARRRLGAALGGEEQEAST
jgi:RNA polymerase sigma-70 factor (ECF subfamily)